MQYSLFTINRKTKSTNSLLLLYLLKLMFHSGVLIPVMLTNVHLKAGLVLELFPTKLTTDDWTFHVLPRYVSLQILLVFGSFSTLSTSIQTIISNTDHGF